MGRCAHIEVIDPQSPAIEKKEYDFCILGKGHEDRSYCFLSMAISCLGVQKWIALDFRAHQEQLSQDALKKYNQFDELIARKSSGELSVISLEGNSVGTMLQKENISSESKIALDITSLDFWELSNILFFLIKIRNVKVLDVFYTEPNMYHYQNNDISQYDHSAVEVSVNYIPEYFSNFVDENESLVTMIGFQKSIASQMKDTMEVASYYSINGFPSYYPKAKDISQVNNYDYLSEIPRSNRKAADASNPFICYNTLVDIASVSGGVLTLCPLGSKPMALGACMYALDHESSTRIIYPFKCSIRTQNDGVGRIFRYAIT